jgi:hypothetical protein
MALHLDPDRHLDPEREERQRARAARIHYRPAARIARVGRRALACPSCGLPLAIRDSVGLFELVACGFCEGVAPTREYLRDEGWPGVELIARLP